MEYYIINKSVEHLNESYCYLNLTEKQILGKWKRIYTVDDKLESNNIQTKFTETEINYIIDDLFYDKDTFFEDYELEEVNKYE